MYTLEARAFLAELELDRRNRSEREQDFREGRRITREEGRRRERRRTKEEWHLEIEEYCALAEQEQAQ
jgi:hypothetical protein